MSEITTIAVDIGSGITKVVSGAARSHFASIAGPVIEGRIQVDGADAHSIVEFDGQCLCVGEPAYSLVHPNGLADSSTPEWHTTEAYRALLYAAISRVLPAGDNGKVALCTGLPIAYFNAARDDLINRLIGEHRFRVEGRQYRVTLRRPNLFVAPQVLGLYFWALARLPDMGARRCAFIDVGSFTTGWAMVENYELVQWAKGGVPIGVSKVRDALEAFLLETFGIRGRATVDAALMSGSVHVDGHSYPIGDAAAQFTMEATGPLREALRGSWGSGRDADIYVGGGGADLFYPSVRSVFPHAKKLPAEQPIYAVVDGYARWLEQRLMAKESVA